MSEHEVMTIDEVCALLRIHKSTAYRLIKSKKLPSFRVGRDHRFNREQIDKWRLEQEQNGYTD